MSGLQDFNGADTDPLPSPWASASGWGNLRRTSNQCANSAGSDTDSAMRRTDSTATLSKVEYRSGDFDGGPAFLDSSGNGYITTSYSGAHVEFYKVTGGPSYEKVGGNHTVSFVAGDTASLELDGNDLVFYKNDVEVGRETDSTFRTGLTPALFLFAGNLRLDNHTDGAAGGQNIDVGLASETDSVLALTFNKSKAVGLNTETDSAFSVVVMRGDELGLTEETDSAFSVGAFKSKVVGLPTTTDTALTVTVQTGGDLPTSYSTNFPATENPLSEGGMFRVGTETAFYGTPRTTPGKCFAATFVGEIAADYDDCLAHLINHAVPNDHQVTATVFRASSYNPSDTHEVGLYLRMVIGEEFVRGYEILFSAGGSFQVVRWEGTDHDLDNFFTGISVSGPGPGTLADGDEISAQVIGDEFEVFKNGVSVATFTDSTFSDGNPGMGFFVRPGDTTKENFCITSWAASGIVNDVVVGLTSETDSAFSVGVQKSSVVGLTSEDDLALGVGRFKSLALNLASETDNAITVPATRNYSAGLATETDSVFSVGKSKSLSVGLALEIDAVFGVIGGEESGGSGTKKRLGLGLGLG